MGIDAADGALVEGSLALNKHSLTNACQAYIGLGSNLSDPIEQIRQALAMLALLPRTEGLCCSPLYRSKAVGPGNQPDYINAVAGLRTQLEPMRLLRELQAIENLQGRQRQIVWGARTLDLDLLLYDKLCVDTDILQLPHPHMLNRNFVIYPLYDVAPELLLPHGQHITDVVAKMSQEGLVKLADEPITGPSDCATGDE